MSTSSTPGFRKLGLVVAVLAITLGIYITLNFCLIMLSDWVERTQRGHPFRQQDWLRYQLDSYLDQANREDVILVGPSAVRENVLGHGIDPKTPGARVFVAALSEGTLEDTVLGLEYIERVHGAAHVPSTIIFGVTARSIAGIHNYSSFTDSSPFQYSLQRYSPHFVARPEGGEMHLAEKTMLQSWLGQVRFFFTQRNRYRTTLYATIINLLGDSYDSEALFANIGDLQMMFRATEFAADELKNALDVVRRLGIVNSALLWLQLSSSPYKYAHLTPLSLTSLEHGVSSKEGLWGRTYLWDPATDRDSIIRLLKRLREFIERHDALLVVVNLPEHPLSVEQYQADRYDEYLEILDQGLGDTPFLNCRTLLSADEFYDIIHATPLGATKLTEHVNGFLQTLR